MIELRNEGGAVLRERPRLQLSGHLHRLNEQNNDFSYAQNFSFDVTRYIGKHRKIRYNGHDENPSDSLLKKLTLVALWHPACGDMGVAEDNTGIDWNTAYDINAISFGEYES